MLRSGQNPTGFYRNRLYLTRYPQIATMLDDPGINHICRHIFYRCGVLATRTANLDLFENGVFQEDPGFVNITQNDFRLRTDSKLFQTVGFKAIPFEEIGLYNAPSRASWPVITIPVNVPSWR